jgi:hypothetical protein
VRHVSDRVVLDLHREPPDANRLRDSFRHRPRCCDTLVLQTEIPVE